MTKCFSSAGSGCRIFLLLVCILFLSSSSAIQAQVAKGQAPVEDFLCVSAGRSKHGSGDIFGFAFSTGYEKRLRHRLSLATTLGATLHDDVEELFYTGPNGEMIDGSIRFTTGGAQITLGVQYDAIQYRRAKLFARLSLLSRYQSTSYPDAVTVLYPPITGLPIPVVYFENSSPARTYSVGGNGMLGCGYLINQKLEARIFGDFQLDTNGDVLSQIGLSVGRRF